MCKLIEGVNSRYCLGCNELKSFDCFLKQKNGKYGYRSRCNPCRKNRTSKDIKYEKNNKIKKCSRCKKFKPFDKFYPSDRYRHNLYLKCKSCVSIEQKNKRLIKNSIKRNFEEFRDKLNQSKFCSQCFEYKSFDSYYKGKSKYKLTASCIQCSKKRYQRNKEKLQKWQTKYIRERRRNNIELRIKDALRGRIYKTLKGHSKSKSTERLLGLSIEEFKSYIERQFEDGMNWENYGEWHIDHIVPCARFDLSKPHHQEECFFYTNLQPLWGEENLKKSDKII